MNRHVFCVLTDQRHKNRDVGSDWHRRQSWPRDDARRDDNGEGSESFVNEHETFWNVLQMLQKSKRQPEDQKAACSVEHDLSCSHCYSAVDQRPSNVLGVHKNTLRSRFVLCSCSRLCAGSFVRCVFGVHGTRKSQPWSLLQVYNLTWLYISSFLPVQSFPDDTLSLKIKTSFRSLLLKFKILYRLFFSSS